MAITISGSGTITGINSGGLNDNIITKNEMATGGAWAPNGTILQVVQGLFTAQFSTSSATYVDVGLSASITPSSASSKILVMVAINNNSSGSPNGLGMRLLRDGTSIFDPSPFDSGGNPYYQYGYNQYVMTPIDYLDSPATTSSVTYKLQTRIYSGNTVQINGGASVSVPGKSTITLMEVAA